MTNNVSIKIITYKTILPQLNPPPSHNHASPYPPPPSFPTQTTLLMTLLPPNRLTNSSGVATVKSFREPRDWVLLWPNMLKCWPDMVRLLGGFGLRGLVGSLGVGGILVVEWLLGEVGFFKVV